MSYESGSAPSFEAALDQTPESSVPPGPTATSARGPAPQTCHALTIDLEDWHQLSYHHVTGDCCATTGNVVTDTHRILDLLAELDLRATFFVVGLVATAFPDLVREVAAAGHEIGGHTCEHETLYAMTSAELKADIERSRGQLQDLTGQPVISFRAPAFSVGSLHNDAFFETLAAAGFECDSSVFPVARLRYGIPDAPRYPFIVQTESGPIHEFPLATWDLGGRRLPVAGGTCFRFLPGAVLEWVVGDLDACGHTATFYFHPYEFHHGLLHLSRLTWHDRLQAMYVKRLVLHNLFTGSVCERWEMLLAGHRFLPIGDIHRNEPIH
jgi:polysaccharide deacetylase family protein (PEP-CTERM system associated)